MKKILVTGFEPFLGQNINPSMMLAKALRDRFDVLILPVSFEKSWSILRQQLGAGTYDFVLMLGQAGGRGKISLEQVALNFLDSKYADEEGQKFTGHPISDSGPEAFISKLPLSKWAEELALEGHNIERSLSAGSYVCNYVYYRVQDFQKEKDKSLFVHFPYLPEQTQIMSQQSPCMSFDEMYNTLKRIIDRILEV